MTDAEFQSIIADTAKRVAGNLMWADDRQHTGAQEFRIRIQSDGDYPLFLVGRYNDAMGKLTYAIIHESEGRLYGLDLGANHRNPRLPGERRGQLLTGTHKHYWTEQHRDKWAYQPPDITESWNRPLQVWRQFCAEARIDHQGMLELPAAQGDFLL